MLLQKRQRKGRGIGRLLKTSQTLRPSTHHPPSSRALKPEAEVDEDGVIMCSGPVEGEEVGQVQVPGEEWS